jgi:hypothetical protein
MTVKNDSPEIVNSIDWDYVFIDPQTQKEPSRRQFRTEEKVRPGKHKSLIEYSISAPIKVIDVSLLAKGKLNPCVEKVFVRRVTYDDGSIWQL